VHWLGVTALCLGLTGAAFVCAAQPADVTARFSNPPADARILKIIHGWPDAPEAQDRLIAQLQRQGFGGVVCNVSFDHYLESAAKWQAFARAVKAAKAAGLCLWLYDERGYPSGNAGGLVLRDHPEWEARGLLAAHIEVTNGPVELAVPPGKPVIVAAFSEKLGRIDLATKVDLSGEVRDGVLRWQAPDGRWWVVAVTEHQLYDGTHAELNLWQKMPYINLLMPEPTARFIELTHQRYAEQLGADLGRWFVATFTDEPSLMSCFLKPMPYRPLPWAPGLPAAFQHRRGYPLDERVVLALLTDTGPGTAKYRYDFWLTVGELVSENFFGQLQSWCQQHNLASGGHLLMEESLVAHVPLYGEFFRCIRRLDAPSIDCLTSLPGEVPWWIGRLLASAAELEGHSLVMSETSDHAQRYRPAGDTRPKRTVPEAEIRGTCNRLMVAGVNCITSYYSFTDLDDAALRRLNEWIGRCCMLLRGGHQVADLALVYPEESVWVRFTPSRHWAREAAEALEIERTYRAAADSLFAAQRDFTVVDSRALQEARVESGTLVHGALRWRVVVLPATDTLPLAAWQRLADLVRSGGVVIALGALPINSATEFPSPPVERLATELFGRPGAEPHLNVLSGGGAAVFLPRGSEALLPVVVRGLVEPDVKLDDPNAPIRLTHRRVHGRELYFLINDSPQPWSGEVRFAAEGAGELLEPGTGRITPNLQPDRVRLSLEPYGAVLAQFPAARIPRRLPAKAGPLPGLNLRPLPRVEPTLAHGQWVRGTLQVDRERSGLKAAPVWEATGILTRSQVDTFLFVRFHYPTPLDLTEAEVLVLESWVPAGQRTGPELLLILSEEGGEDFLAHMGRPLSAAGYQRSFVPLSQFRRAGWSKSGDGQLDRKRISEVRIGWGGYLGTQDEAVQFMLAQPSLGVVDERMQ